jgi:hypothetical protein
MSKAWEFTPRQMEGVASPAPMFLDVGGIRSGKTAGALLEGVIRYLLRYPFCNMLVVRKTFPELKAGPMEDFRRHVPRELYEYNDTAHTASFLNGSRLVFGHCKNGKESDVQQYLGTAYPFIVVDECAQFSPDCWELFRSRNTVNPECMECPDRGDPGFGRLPFPRLRGCTNPFGHYWSYYKDIFIDRRPSPIPEGARRDRSGRWWTGIGTDPVCVYDPQDYAYCHSTVLDNPHALERDPGIVQRLQAMPEGKRRKFLYGELEGAEGVYFDCWDGERHVISLRDDPEAVIWEPWQPVWAGWDWAIGGHWSALFFFTIALVKNTLGVLVRKCVCWKEYVLQGKTARDMGAILAQTLRTPWDGQFPRVNSIFFSHEKFARTVEEHSPADEVSKELRKIGLPSVTPGTRDRIGRATLVYSKLRHGELAVLDSCPEAVRSIPILPRDPDRLDDVLKPSGASKPDDVYDGFSYGLYGYYGPRMKSAEQAAEEKAAALKDTDPFAWRLAAYKIFSDARRKAREDAQGGARPSWYGKASSKRAANTEPLG